MGPSPRMKSKLSLEHNDLLREYQDTAQEFVDAKIYAARMRHILPLPSLPEIGSYHEKKISQLLHSSRNLLECSKLLPVPLHLFLPENVAMCHTCGDP